MPLYEYKCDGCGEVFELIQRFSDQPLTVHEKCGGPLQKLISVSALKFKGSGWYINDYAKAGSGAAANGESKAGGEPKTAKSGGESKPGSDSKPGGDSKSGGDSKPASSTSSDSGGKTESKAAATPSPAKS